MEAENDEFFLCLKTGKHSCFTVMTFNDSTKKQKINKYLSQNSALAAIKSALFCPLLFVFFAICLYAGVGVNYK